MEVGDVVVRVVARDDNFTAIMQRARREAQALGESVKSVGHGTVSSMQAASASIRLLEGDMTRNVRAVEKFITTIPGVGAALQAAFPVIGVVAFLGVIGKVAEEIAKAKNELAQVRNVANEAFATLTEGAQKNADSLRVTNDKLEQQIAMMEHKPVNNLALALDEARLRADELAASLNKDYEAFKKVIEQSQSSVLNNLLGNGVDKKLGSDMQNQLANIRTLARQQRDELKAGNQGAAADTGNKLRAAQDASLSFADQQTGVRNEIANAGDPDFKSSYLKKQGMNLDAISAFKDLVSSQEDVADQQNRNTKDESTKQQLEAAKAMSEAQKKAQELLLKQDEEQLKAENAFNKLTINEEIAFWNARIAAFSRGSDQYMQVQNKIYDLIAKRPSLTTENRKNQAAAGKSAVEGSDLLAAGGSALSKINAGDMEKALRDAEKFAAIESKTADVQARNASAFNEMAINISLAQGTMSELDAAQVRAALHAQDHEDALKRITAELELQKDLINDPRSQMSDEQKSDALRDANQKANEQRDAVNGQFATQNASDKQSIRDQQLGPAMQDTVRGMAQDWSNMTRSILQTMTRAIDSFNNDIAAAITGHGSKASFGRTFSQAGEGLVKTGLQKGEAELIGSIFGKGKGPAGSSPLNRQYVSAVIEGSGLPTGAPGAGVGVGSAAGILGSLGGFGKFIQPFAGLLPHFANGGDPLPNYPSIVGERGPEMFVPKTAGSIIPHEMMGGGPTFHIDARGSNDPAAIHAAIMRAAPHIAASAVQAQHSMSKRTPRGR
jgi:hypothetical protein